MITVNARFLNMTPLFDMQEAAMNTVNKQVTNNMTPELFKKYLVSEHSPIRSAIIRITLNDIPYYSSVHFARHVHALHFVSTNRPDRVKKERSVDDTVNHIMDCNLQSLIDMARKRLCTKSAIETREIMLMIKHTLMVHENEYMRVIGEHLEPNCLYRGKCPEFKSCGFFGGM